MKSKGFITWAMIILLPLFISQALIAEAMEQKEHQQIQPPLKDGQAVTRVCLSCHEKEARDFMRTSHWSWTSLQEVAGVGHVKLGKRSAINSFCIQASANWPRCTSCHAGYGWRDPSFDFNDPTRIDCLVCHDQTGEYKKSPAGAGNPEKGLDLVKIARRVGKPNRLNCGVCHFFGGGGDGVKHGDLDTSLLNPTGEFDVHMGTDTLDMTCQECHTATRHRIKGGAMVASPGHTNHLFCADCHEEHQHEASQLDRHALSVSCQTCHIPYVAKKNPTKVWWDWSKAGQKRPETKDQYGMPAYDPRKGEFRWAKNLLPTDLWYVDGRASVYQMGDRIDPSKPTALNWPVDGKENPAARISPFKAFRGKQPYDKKHLYFIAPKLFGEGGFWDTMDWLQASEKGMKEAGLPFSGEVGFAETIMYWRLNHMVVPADQALNCKDCHTKEDGRLDWKALGYEGDPRSVPRQARVKSLKNK